MRGLKEMKTVSTLLDDWVVHYNYVRSHQTLKGKTPAQASGIEIEDNWHTLVNNAIKHKTRKEIEQQEKPIMVIAK